MRLYSAENEQKIGKYITVEEWARIEHEISFKIKPFVHLGYYYGLRRAESLAASIDWVFEKNLIISRQLVEIAEGKSFYSPLKNRKTRQTPHWQVEAEFAYDIINGIKLRMHPDTLDDLFRQEMKKLGFDFHFHDLRRTFITDMLKKHMPTVVKNAVGHSDIKTTMRYYQEIEQIDKPFQPKRKLKSV